MKENILAIGKRCSVLIKQNIFSLVILPTVEKRKTGLLFLWLFAWTVSGLIVIMSYTQIQEQSTKLFIVVWIAFWAYFEFKIVKVFMWKKFGKENFWIKNGILHYQQTINGRGKIKEYDLNLVTELNVIELTKGSIADTFSQTFWVKGGERLEFVCQQKSVKFGMQLEDADAEKIILEIKRFLKV